MCVSCGSERLIGHGRNEQVIRDMLTYDKRVSDGSRTWFVVNRLSKIYDHAT